MYFDINGERLVGEIQQMFNGIYPFLKLEFLKHENCGEDCYCGKTGIPANWPLKEIWHIKKDKGLLKICDSMPVADFENEWLEEYGLIVRVLRRSGDSWSKTSITDSWTLRQQNDHGKELTTGKERMVKFEKTKAHL